MSAARIWIKKCCVLGCRNRTDSKLSFFRIPKDTERAKMWYEAVGRDPGPVYVLVCEEHFADRDIMKSSQRKRLRPDAVPTRRLPSASAIVTARAAAVRAAAGFGQACEPRSPSPDPPVLDSLPFHRTAPPKPHQYPLEFDSEDLTTLVTLSLTHLTPELAQCVETQLMLAKEKEAIAQGDLSDENFLFESFKLRLTFPQTYKVMWKPLGLPSPGGLRRLFRPLTWEINEQWARELRARVETARGEGRECAVCVARAPLRPALDYDAVRDRVLGLDELDGQQRPRVATGAVVVWARAVHDRWQQPLACSLLTDGVDFQELWLWIDIIVSKLFDVGFKVRALVTDYPEEINTARPVDEKHPFDEVKDRQIYRLHGWTDIIIALHDCLTNHDIGFGGKVASWKDVVRLVEHDSCNSVKLAPGLTPAHVKSPHVPPHVPPLERALAVLAAPVAGALAIAVERGVLPPAALGTAQLINSVSSLYEIMKKKTLSSKVAPQSKILNEKHDLNVLMELQRLFEDMTLLPVFDGRETKDQSVLGALRGGVRALLALAARARVAGHAALPTHAFDIEPLRNFFSACYDPTLPTSKQVLHSFRKSFVLNVMKSMSKVSERDDYENFLSAARSMRGVSSKERVFEKPVRMVALAKLQPLLAATGLPRVLVERLLGLCLAQHPGCAAMRQYCEGSVLPVALLELLQTLEGHVAALTTAEGHMGLGPLLLLAARVPFSPPCPGFPLNYLKTLYMSFRLRSLIEHNNEIILKRPAKVRHQGRIEFTVQEADRLTIAAARTPRTTPIISTFQSQSSLVADIIECNSQLLNCDFN